jgi:hypothetical protein
MVMPMSEPGASRVSAADGAQHTWKNWSGNVVYTPSRDGETYYHSPVDRTNSNASCARRQAPA